VASAVLAYGQPLQEATKNIREQLVDNFNALSGILIEKCSFQVSRQFNAKSGATDQLPLGDRLVDHPCCRGLYFFVCSLKAIIS